MAGAKVKGQVKTPFGRLTFGVMLGYGLMMVALMTPATLLLTFKMIEIDPNGYTSSYGLVAGIGAFFALIGNPLGGAISDRTIKSIRTPAHLILLGPLVGSAALLMIGWTSSLWLIIVGWAIAQLFFNFGMAAYTALIPDQVKEEKQGTISGLLGMSLPLGIVVGMVLMTLLPDVSSAAKWTLIAAIGIVGPVISLFLIQEGKVEIIREHNTAVPLGEKLSKIYPSPRRFPVFSWAVASKFLMMMGYCSSLYLTVMLVNRMGYTEAQATSSVATVNIISTIAMALTSIFGGMLSDKFRKQKPFLYLSAFIMVIAVLVFAFVPHYTAYVVASAVLGPRLRLFLRRRYGFGGAHSAAQRRFGEGLRHHERGKRLAAIDRSGDCAASVKRRHVDWNWRLDVLLPRSCHIHGNRHDLHQAAAGSSEPVATENGAETAGINLAAGNIN
ncbi:MFS transporter [Paenibacillus sp. JTLBN-2024]